MAIKKIRINEDFEDRLGYLIKQYQSGWLYIDNVYIQVLDEDENIIDEWDQSSYTPKLIYVTQQKSTLDKETGNRISHTQSNEIADKIFYTMYDDIKRYFIKNVPLKYIIQETTIFDDSGINSINIIIPFNIKYDSIEVDEDGSNIYYPNDTKFDLNGNYHMVISYTFTLNNKPVNGKLLSLLTDIETV